MTMLSWSLTFSHYTLERISSSASICNPHGWELLGSAFLMRRANSLTGSMDGKPAQTTSKSVSQGFPNRVWTCVQSQLIFKFRVDQGSPKIIFDHSLEMLFHCGQEMDVICTFRRRGHGHAQAIDSWPMVVQSCLLSWKLTIVKTPFFMHRCVFWRKCFVR